MLWTNGGASGRLAGLVRNPFYAPGSRARVLAVLDKQQLVVFAEIGAVVPGANEFFDVVDAHGVGRLL